LSQHDDEEIIRAKVKTAVTDPARVTLKDNSSPLLKPTILMASIFSPFTLTAPCELSLYYQIISTV
jgi:hypothetical protein